MRGVYLTNNCPGDPFVSVSFFPFFFFTSSRVIRTAPASSMSLRHLCHSLSLPPDLNWSPHRSTSLLICLFACWCSFCLSLFLVCLSTDLYLDRYFHLAPSVPYFHIRWFGLIRVSRVSVDNSFFFLSFFVCVSPAALVAWRTATTRQLAAGSTSACCRERGESSCSSSALKMAPDSSTPPLETNKKKAKDAVMI